MSETRKRKIDTQGPVGASEAEAREERTVLNEPEATPASEVEAQAPAGEAQAAVAVEQIEAEKAELHDKLLRLAAEMDNLRKRTERDLAETSRYAIARFAADMLTVGDNLRRALDAVPQELRGTGDNALAALTEGVEMTARELDRLLEKHGVKRIPAQGERFDPHLHQAMFEVPDASVPPGTIVQVIQDGYTIGDRVLRAAMVGVAKAPPEPDNESQGAESPA